MHNANYFNKRIKQVLLTFLTAIIERKNYHEYSCISENYNT